LAAWIAVEIMVVAALVVQVTWYGVAVSWRMMQPPGATQHLFP
jgi:hypothetical protein